MKAWTLIEREKNKKRPVGRSEHSGCVYKDKLYLFGGEKYDSGKLNDFWEFDIENSSWKQVETHTIGPSERGASSCVKIENFIYVFGGFDIENTNNNHLFRFSFETREWIQLKSKNPPSARHYFTLNPVQIENDLCLILFAGHLYHGETSDELFIYDIKSNTWIQKRSHKFRRFGHTSVIYKNKLFVFAGEIKSENTSALLSNDLIEYDIETDTWKDCFTVGLAPTPRKSHQSTVIRDSMFVLGDVKDPDLHEFNFLENRWYTYKTNLNIHLFAFNLSAHQESNSVFLFGGFNNDLSCSFDELLQLNVGNPRRTLSAVDCFKTFFQKTSFLSDLTIITCDDGFKEKSDGKELVIVGSNVKTKTDDEIEQESQTDQNMKLFMNRRKRLLVVNTNSESIADRVKKRKEENK